MSASLWAEVFVNGLMSSGLKEVCIAPGSRSTPLVLALAKQKDLTIYTHLDERSCGFFALGLSLKNQRPTALVCTSGTAAANFFPAIIEAHQSRVPLLVLTADRPAELQDSGANQSIRQANLYGAYALWHSNTPLPEAKPNDLSLRHLHSLAARALAKTMGLRKGVVHINMPFRKPLEPESPKTYKHAFQTVSIPAVKAPELSQAVLNGLVKDITTYDRGLIICGPKLDSAAHRAVEALAERSGYPIFADPLSGLRFKETPSAETPGALGAYDLMLRQNPDSLQDCDIILRFGDVPTSSILQQALSRCKPKRHIQISPDGHWADDSHSLSDFLVADAEQVCKELSQTLAKRPVSAFAKRLNTLERHTWNSVRTYMAEPTYFDGAVIYDLLALLPDKCNLFVGNSLAIRHIDQLGQPQHKNLTLYANRGASGIDGNLSTALGIAAQSPEPSFALVGDISFYHDMNGLLANSKLETPMTIILMNNQGGGIFKRLPIAKFEPEFSQYFLMPHALDFKHAAALYKLDYQKVTNRQDFKQAFKNLDLRQGNIIDVLTTVDKDHKHFTTLLSTINHA